MAGDVGVMRLAGVILGDEGGGQLVSTADSQLPCEAYAMMPSVAPAIRAISVDQDGRVWIERTGERLAFNHTRPLE